MRCVTMRALVAVLALITISGTGCHSSSAGKKIDDQQVQKIVKGRTTRAEVLQMFGTPSQNQLMPDGKRLVMYAFTETRGHVKGESFIPFAGAFVGGSEGTTHTQQLQITLNKDGIVEDFDLTDTEQDFEAGGGY